jgi:HEAT repeats
MASLRADTQDGESPIERELLALIEEFERSGSVNALDQFRRALSDGSPPVRAAAARAIAAHGQVSDAGALRAALHAEKVPSVRAAIVEGLGFIGDLETVGVLSALAHSEDTAEIRSGICHALGRLGNPDGVGALEHLSGDPRVEVRDAAQMALRAIRMDSVNETYLGALRLTKYLNQLTSFQFAELPQPREAGEAEEPDSEAVDDPVEWLRSSGVVFSGRVPDDIAVWARWANRLATNQPLVSRGWKLLNLREAIDHRQKLAGIHQNLVSTALPLLRSYAGDYQIYVPTSVREGRVASCYYDESFEFSAYQSKRLVDFAEALIDSWNIIQASS